MIKPELPWLIGARRESHTHMNPQHSPLHGLSYPGEMQQMVQSNTSSRIGVPLYSDE